MLRIPAFREYFVRVADAKSTTLATYGTYLNKIDRTLGGLDEAIAERGAENLLAWARETTESPFDTSRSHARSVLKRYLQFHLDAEAPDDALPEDLPADDVVSVGSIFRLEREMQAAVRKQLERLEPGLHEADGGMERDVATGRIDILCSDAEDNWVVVELKAGPCPQGAMEQALGYAQSLLEELEDEKSVRVLLVASEFSDRLRSAAKLVPCLTLKNYQFSLTFNEVE